MSHAIGQDGLVNFRFRKQESLPFLPLLDRHVLDAFNYVNAAWLGYGFHSLGYTRVAMSRVLCSFSVSRLVCKFHIFLANPLSTLIGSPCTIFLDSSIDLTGTFLL